MYDMTEGLSRLRFVYGEGEVVETIVGGMMAVLKDIIF